MKQRCVLGERAGVAKAGGEMCQEAQTRPVWLRQKGRGRAGDEGRELQVHSPLAEAGAAGCVTHPDFSAFRKGPDIHPGRGKATSHDLPRECACLEIYEHQY